MDLEHEKRLTEVEQRAKSNSHRIEKMEKIVDEIHEMSTTMVRLCEQSKTTNETVESLRDDVNNLKSEPAERWKASTKALFNAALGAIGTAIGGGIIYLITTSIK